MRVLNDTLFLAAPSYRSRAYAQAMMAGGILPGRLLMLPGTEPIWDGPAEIEVPLTRTTPFRFVPGETVETTLARAGVRVVQAVSADVNSADFIDALKGFEETVVIYSGVGGVIVRAPTLQVGKQFLHVHGGWAPVYRGSTAFYYSVLDDGTIGATALWLTEVLDGGPILERRKYRPAVGIEIDRIQDPIARADVLMSVLVKRAANGCYPAGISDMAHAKTYYVIHPVLKHVALGRAGYFKTSSCWAQDTK